MMRSKATAKHRIAALGMAAALILSIAPVNALADDEIGEYKVGDTFTSESADAELPENIPENTKWVGPEEVITPDIEAGPICGLKEDTAYWTGKWDKYYEKADYENLVSKNTYYATDDGKHVSTEENVLLGYTFQRKTYSGYNTVDYTGTTYYKKTSSNNGYGPGPGGPGGNHDRYEKVNPAEYTGDLYGYDQEGWYGGTYVLLTPKYGTVYSVETYTTHTHGDSCYPVKDRTYVWTLKGYTVDSVTIEDHIADQGKLVAKVTGDAVSYQWYMDGNTAIVGATGAELNAFNEAHEAVVTAGHSYTVKAYGYQDTTGKTSKAVNGQYYTELKNGGFETPKVVGGDGFYQYDNGTDGLYWKTTSSDPRVELFVKGSYWHFLNDGEDINEGADKVTSGINNQAAELNAEQPGALYQDVLTEPGSTLHWSFVHRGRYSNNTMVLVIDNVTNGTSNISDRKNIAEEYVQATATDYLTWSYHKGSYVVPAGQYVTRFYFVSVNDDGNSQGNYLDNVTFSATKAPDPVKTYGYTINYYVDGDKQSADTETGDANEGAVVNPSKMLTYMNQYDGNYDVDNLPGLTITTDSSKNVLDLHFTTPSYTVEYYTIKNGNTTKIATPDGAQETGKAVYGTTVSKTSLSGIPTEISEGNETYQEVDHDGNSITMTRDGENVVKIYFEYKAPDYKHISYAWTNDTPKYATSRPVDAVLPAADNEILDLSTYEVKSLPTTAEKDWEISGWFTDSEGTIPYDAATTVLHDNDVLYARLVKKASQTFNVYYMWANGSEILPTVNLPENQRNIELDDLHKITVSRLTGLPEGYTFEGWYRDAAHTDSFDDADLSNVNGDITLYAYITYKAPEHPYTVVYEYFRSSNGGKFTSVGKETIVDKTMITKAKADSITTETIQAEAPAVKEYGGVKYAIGSRGTDCIMSGNWSSNDLTYTVNYYYSTYTEGSLTIKKIVSGLSDTKLLKDLTFSVYAGSNETLVADETPVATVSYKDFRDGKYTIKDLPVGTYTVTETNGEVAGYTWDVTKTSHVVSILDTTGVGEAYFLNKYTEKTYNIYFDGNEHGTITYGGQRWTIQEDYEEVNGESRSTGKEAWTHKTDDATVAGAVAGKNQTRYILPFSKLNGVGKSIPMPTVTAEEGYKVLDGWFTGADGSGEKFTTPADAVAYMDAKGETSVVYYAQYEGSGDSGNGGETPGGGETGGGETPGGGETGGGETPAPTPSTPSGPADDGHLIETLPDADVPKSEIPDDDVPLTDVPEENVPMEELPDGDIPLADVPQTGDPSAWLLLAAAVSGCGLALLMNKRKKAE